MRYRAPSDLEKVSSQEDRESLPTNETIASLPVPRVVQMEDDRPVRLPPSQRPWRNYLNPEISAGSYFRNPFSPLRRAVSTSSVCSDKKLQEEPIVVEVEFPSSGRVHSHDSLQNIKAILGTDTEPMVESAPDSVQTSRVTSSLMNISPIYTEDQGFGRGTTSPRSISQTLVNNDRATISDEIFVIPVEDIGYSRRSDASTGRQRTPSPVVRKVGFVESASTIEEILKRCLPRRLGQIDLRREQDSCQYDVRSPKEEKTDGEDSELQSRPKCSPPRYTSRENTLKYWQDASKHDRISPLPAPEALMAHLALIQDGFHENHSFPCRCTFHCRGKLAPYFKKDNRIWLWKSHKTYLDWVALRRKRDSRAWLWTANY